MSCGDSQQIHNWHLEISSKCTLKCPRCSRTEEAGKYPVTELSLDLIKKIFNPDFLRKNVKRITLSGGLGDPLYHSELIEMIRYLKSHHPDFQLVLVTNGSYKKRNWWQELASVVNHMDEIIFSIDGWDHESNNIYRKNSDWNSIMEGLEVMTQSPALIRWSTIVFRFNQSELDRIQALAEAKGVDHFHLTLSERFGSTYADPTTGVDDLEPQEEFKSQITRSQRFKTKFPSWKNKSSRQRALIKELDHLYQTQYQKTLQEYGSSYVMPSCQFGYRGIYVDIEGLLYPCSWVSHPYGEKSSKYQPERKQVFAEGFARYRDRVNLNKRSVEEILNDPFWLEWKKSWQHSDTADVICESKCINTTKSIASLGTKPMEVLNK